MKFGELKAIGHNIADSLASGSGWLIGYYATDIFGEAANSPEGYILIDFIAGTASGARPSALLANAISLYSKALDNLCERHGTSVSVFLELKARYTHDIYGGRFAVTVRDQQDHHSTDEYLGSPGRRVLELDDLGRLRPKRHRNEQ